MSFECQAERQVINVSLPDPIARLLKEGELNAAERLCVEMLDKAGDPADVLATLGLIHARRRRWEEAQACFERILALSSDDPVAWFNLGRVQLVMKQHDAALSSFNTALRLKPDFSEPCFNIGRFHYHQSRWREAQEYFQRALQSSPDVANPRCYLGKDGRDSDQVARDIRNYRALVHNELGKVHRNQGEAHEAVAQYRQALQLKPDFAEAHSHLLFVLSYNVMCAPRELLDQHRAWDRVHGGKDKLSAFSHVRNGDPRRRLRIAYISPAFRFHVISFFMEPILRHHDRERVEVFCYAEVAQPDDFTERLKGMVDGWRSTVGMDDEAVARMIHDDRIDILVDLAGHTNNSRLKALAYKPAPVQATYLGYFSTTGMAAMDYWLTDEVLHPAGTKELATEALYRLPRCCVCYQPPDPSPEVAPAREDVAITFGSFNDLLKTTPRAIALWSRVLQNVPGSRLLLKTGALADARIRETVQQRFAAHDIGPERLILRPQIQSHYEHMASYGAIDIALDTVPRTGGTTTADALWMGVPVVSLAGDLFIERLSATMISAVGAGELIADSEDAYVEKAVALAGDAPRRKRLRETLRPRMAASALCDGPGMARAMEDAFRDMWKRHLLHNGDAAR